MDEVEMIKENLFNAIRSSGITDAEEVIKRLDLSMKSWTNSQIHDYFKYTMEGAYTTRLPEVYDEVEDDNSLLVRTGQTVKCVIFRKDASGVHILIKPPLLQPDPELAAQSERPLRERLVETTTQRRNAWKIPGGRTNVLDSKLAQSIPLPPPTGVLLMTALREMTEEFGHCLQVVLQFEAELFSYEIATESLTKLELNDERPLLLLYAHRTHGPEVWEAERVAKYPGVIRRSKVMFIIGEVHDPLQKLPLSTPVYEEAQSNRRPNRWWPYSALVHDDWIARGILPNMAIDDFLLLEYIPAHLPSPLHRRSLLDMQHWVSSEGTGLYVTPFNEDSPAQVETSEDKTMLKRQEKLATMLVERIDHRSLPIRKERAVYEMLMSWPAHDEKTLVDFTKQRHEGGEKSAMFGFRYRIPKRTTIMQNLNNLAAVEARSRLVENVENNSSPTNIDQEVLLRGLFEREYGLQPKPFLKWEAIESVLQAWLNDWIKKNPNSKSQKNLFQYLNLWLTSIQTLNLYRCGECGAEAGAACKKKEPERGELQHLPRFNKHSTITIGKWLGNPASFFQDSSDFHVRLKEFIRAVFIPLLRQALSKEVNSRLCEKDGFLSGLVPHPKGQQSESPEILSSLVERLSRLLKPSIAKDGKGRGIPFVHRSRYLQHFVDVEPFMSLFRSDVKTARRSGKNTDFGKTVSTSLTQQMRIFAAQRRLFYRLREQSYDRFSFVEAPPTIPSRTLWEWVTPMEPSKLLTIAIDDYESVDGLHQIPLLSIEHCDVDEPRFLFNGQGNIRSSSLQQRFVRTNEFWMWGETCPTLQADMETWLEKASSGVGWGKLPIVSPDATFQEAMDVASMSGGYVAIGIDAFIWQGPQGPRNQEFSREDEAWRINSSLFAVDNAQIAKGISEEDVTITRTVSQSINQTAPLFIQRRLLGVLHLPLLQKH